MTAVRARGKRQFRTCTCGRGFYGPPGKCRDCRAGNRAGQLYYRAQIAGATQPRLRELLFRALAVGKA